MRRGLKKPLIILLVVAGIAYVGNKIYKIHQYAMETEVALSGSVSNSLFLDGFIVRKETEIFNNTGGVVNFVLNDGEKINKGGVVASIFKDEVDNLSKKEADKLDREIKALQTLEQDKNKISTNITHLDKRTHQNLKKLILCLNRNDYSSLPENREEVLYLFNERQAIIDKSYDFSGRINELKERRERIKVKPNTEIGTILASESGFFVGNVDGFEEITNYDEVLKSDVSKVKELLQSKENTSSAVAKIVNLPYWYVLSVTDKKNIKNLSEGDTAFLSLPLTNIDKIPAEVAKINFDNADKAVIALKCNYINKDILNLRKEHFRIDFSEYSGIKINKRAIHEKLLKKTLKNEDGTEENIEKKVQGVYVIKNKQLVFKEVLITHADENFVICKEKPNEDEIFSNKYLELFDEIVIEGSDLYDGKVAK